MYILNRYKNNKRDRILYVYDRKTIYESEPRWGFLPRNDDRTKCRAFIFLSSTQEIDEDFYSFIYVYSCSEIINPNTWTENFNVTYCIRNIIYTYKYILCIVHRSISLFSVNDLSCQWFLLIYFLLLSVTWFY